MKKKVTTPLAAFLTVGALCGTAIYGSQFLPKESDILEGNVTTVPGAEGNTYSTLAYNPSGEVMDERLEINLSQQDIDGIESGEVTALEDLSAKVGECNVVFNAESIFTMPGANGTYRFNVENPSYNWLGDTEGCPEGQYTVEKTLTLR